MIWEGTITGFNGGQTVIVRTSFNGSIEGLRAIAESPQSDPPYFLPSVLTVTPQIGGAQEAGAIPRDATTIINTETDIAFSDTDKAISPYASDPMVGGVVGVAVFGLVVNEGSPINNVSAQNYNSILQNGFVPLSFFTGVPADTNPVFATGRNDGSGTRSSYLAEMGFGVSNPISQYLVVARDGNEIKAVQKVPAGGVNDPLHPDLVAFNTANPNSQIIQDTRSASIVWGNDIDGNGGAFSGGALRADMGRLGSSVSVFDSDGSDLFGAPQADISLVTWLSLNDAVTARGLGGSIVAFNGYSLDVNADVNGNVITGGTFMSTADREKCYNGQYSAWNFQQMYYKFGSSADTIQLYGLIQNSIPTNLGSAGLKTEDFRVGRANDGGTMNPLF